MRFSNTTLSFSAVLAAVLFIASCGGEDPFRVDYSTAPDPFPIEEALKDTTTESGLRYYVIEEGTGERVVGRRDVVHVFYTGRTPDGKIFDSSYRNGNTMPSTFGDIGTLIEGFREGLIGMKENEKRVLIIPPDIGYGNSPSHQLSDDTLRFDIELDEIQY